MKPYTLIVQLSGAPAAAVAVEWTTQAAPAGSGQGWEPCLKLGQAVWRLSSWSPDAAAAPHLRDPGVFSGIAIRYRLTPAGAWSQASAERKEFVITAETEEGGIIGPVAILAPSLVGTGRIGTEVNVEPGLWHGEPALWYGFQWRRGGAAIPGATARVYTPVAADDRADLDCVVTAGNGVAETLAITAALRVTHVAPRVLATLVEEVFDEDTGSQIVQTASAFAGQNLTFSTSSGVIDARTGALTLTTDTPVTGRVVTVTAANSGGQAAVTLRYTVEAGSPGAFEASDVTVLRSAWRPEGQLTTFSPVMAFPGLTAAERATAQIEFCAGAPTDTTALWHPVSPLAGEAGSYWLPDAFDPVAPAVNVAIWRDDARRTGRLRFRYRLSAAQSWSPASPTFAVPLPRPKANYVVTTSAELKTRWEQATGGQIIEVAPGSNYGEIVISSGITKSPPVTIRAQDPKNPPRWPGRGIIATGGASIQGLILDGLVFRSTAVDRFGYPRGTAMDIRNCRNVTIRNCVFDGYEFQLVASSSNFLTIEWNEFTRVAIDGMRFFDKCTNLLIQNNRLHNPQIDIRRSDQTGGDSYVTDVDGVRVLVTATTKDGRHPDWIQFSCPRDDAGHVNVKILNNYIETFNGYMHGVLFFNERASREKRTAQQAGHRDITIAGNYVHSGHIHALAVSGMLNLVMENNFISRFPPGGWSPNGSDQPGISLYPEVYGVIRNNIWPNWGGDGTYRRDRFWRDGATNLPDYDPLANVTRSGNVNYSPTQTPPVVAKPKVGPYGYQS